MVFGKPKMAVFAHMDTVGFMVRYNDQMVPVGSPEINDKTILTGRDNLGMIECGLRIDENFRVYHTFMRGIQRGTLLSYKPDFHKKGKWLYSPYLDNRMGIWNALMLAHTMKNGIIFFSTGEEQGGGSVSFLTRLMYEKYHVTKALISDVTWITDGILPGNGVVISMKDRYIPSQKFVSSIIETAEKNNIRFQLEVEDNGSSDGGEIQRSPYPVDWCFVGVPCKNIHSPMESMNLDDLTEMNRLYKILLN
jgi:putative aminopeptidase FrvX